MSFNHLCNHFFGFRVVDMFKVPGKQIFHTRSRRNTNM